MLGSNTGTVYSRNGNFSVGADDNLINDQGDFVQGYGVDQNFNLVNSTLSNLSIPVGSLNIAQQTSNVSMSGALKSTGDIATQGSVLQGETLTDSSTSADATGTSLLTDVENDQNGTLTPLFTAGQTLSFSPQKGGKTANPVTLTVTATTTLDDLMTMMSGGLGIQTNSGDPNKPIPDDGGTGTAPGVTISGGQIQIVGNAGTVNDIAVTVGDMLSNGTPGSAAIRQVAGRQWRKHRHRFHRLRFTRTTRQDADDGGARIPIRRSDGLSVLPRIRGRRPDQRGGGQRDDHLQRIGRSHGGREGHIFAGPQQHGGRLADAGQHRLVANLRHRFGHRSEPTRTQKPGRRGAGTLQSFVVDSSGVINGVFDNGLSRVLGQVAIARFANPDGLIDAGNTTFKEGVSSGSALLAAPGTLGAGTIRAGSIELSNTDIGKSLVDLIVASTNYRGNSRVIASVQQLVDELLTLGR